MVIVLARNAWLFMARGIFALLFGLAALFWPEVTLTVLVLLFGVFALMDGIFAIAAAITGAEPRDRWWMLVLEGLAGVLIAAITFMWPQITALALLYLVGVWAILTGILEIVAAVRLRKEIEGEWLMALSGLVSLLFGLYVVVFPGPGALAVVWLIGAYAILFGILFIALGWRLRSHGRTTTAPVVHRDADDHTHQDDHVRAS